ncbi:MAG: hypothetical protein ACLGHX_02840 [Acidimicrobiia bacterium]
MEIMAAWCFLCDAPVDGDLCPTCGRPPTIVEDETSFGSPSRPWWGRIPRRTWIAIGIAVVVVLYSLFQSGFRLVD